MDIAIDMQPTPNPNARKYVIGSARFEGSTNYTAPEGAEPWVGALFALDGVYNVFTAQNFVTVNKRAEVAWEPLETQIREILAAQFANNV